MKGEDFWGRIFLGFLGRLPPILFFLLPSAKTQISKPETEFHSSILSSSWWKIIFLTRLVPFAAPQKVISSNSFSFILFKSRRTFDGEINSHVLLKSFVCVCVCVCSAVTKIPMTLTSRYGSCVNSWFQN